MDDIPAIKHKNSKTENDNLILKRIKTMTEADKDIMHENELNKIQQIYKDLVPKVPGSNEKCTITFQDGKKVDLPILLGTMGPPMIDIRDLYSKSGFFTFDPGFSNTGSCVSQITYIDGEKGELLYRGYKIQEVAEHCDFLECCYLLLYGELPSFEDKKKFDESVKDQMIVHEKLISFYKGFQSGAHPMAILVGVIGALSSFMYDGLDIEDPVQRELSAIKLVAKMPMIAAISFRTAMGLPIIYPRRDLTFTENFLYMMFADPMDKDWQVDKLLADVLDKILILHADHEQNASTATVRIAGSSLANPFACIAAGIASLWGPMHGGANEAVLNMLDEIKVKENIPNTINLIKDKKFRLMGFGHRVYKNFDPRAGIMRTLCYRVFKHLGTDNDPFLELSVELEKHALEDKYFLDRKLYPNVDYYSGIVLKTIGIPNNMFTVIFALARSIGWITQWREMISEKLIKIGRPRQLFVGHKERNFIHIKDRKDNFKEVTSSSKISKGKKGFTIYNP